MAIEFHCEHCGRSVRAPDEAAGKHANCPSCHQKVYIPTPSDQIEIFKLAPVDEGAEREKARLLRETKELTHQILHDREGLGPDRDAQRAAASAAMSGSARPAASPPPAPAISPAAMLDLVVGYAAAMATGDLSRAEQVVDDIRKNPKNAEDAIQRVTMDEIPPPKLAKIPRPVLMGFFKQLRDELKG